MGGLTRSIARVERVDGVFDVLLSLEHGVSILNLSGPPNIGKTFSCCIALSVLSCESLLDSRRQPNIFSQSHKQGYRNPDMAARAPGSLRCIWSLGARVEGLGWFYT